jgi:hypothetical protein
MFGSKFPHGAMVKRLDFGFLNTEDRASAFINLSPPCVTLIHRVETPNIPVKDILSFLMRTIHYNGGLGR